MEASSKSPRMWAAGIQKSAAETGATLVEFAVAIPVLMLLLLGVGEYARLMATHAAIASASREAARYGAAAGLSPAGVPRFTDCDAIRDAGRHVAAILDLADSDFLVGYDGGPGGSGYATCPAGGPYPDPSIIGSGDRISVTVTTHFTSSFPVLGPYLSGPISASDRRTIVKGT